MNSLLSVINSIQSYGVRYSEEPPVPPSPIEEESRYLHNADLPTTAPVTTTLASRAVESTTTDAEQLNKCASAIQQAFPLPPINSDEFRQQLRETLLTHRAEIHAMNITNVFDRRTPLPKSKRYSPDNPSQLIRTLPVSPQALIHSSRIWFEPRGSWISNRDEHCKTLDKLFLEGEGDSCNLM